MPRIIDYGFLFEQMLGNNSMAKYGSFQVNQIGNKSIQSQLKSAGIDTSSAQYKAVVGSMMSQGNGFAFTNVEAIKNRMRMFDKDGDRISAVTGLAGLEVNEKTIANKRKIISIPESSREEMFQLKRKEFLQENGVANGDTTRRMDVYTNLYRKVDKKDRLAAGNTMQQYENAYTQAFVNAIKKINPSWNIGQAIPTGILDEISREDVELKLSGLNGKMINNSVDLKI